MNLLDMRIGLQRAFHAFGRVVRLRESDTSSAAHRPIIGQAPAYAHQR